jgi:hypothetical protein
MEPIRGADARLTHFLMILGEAAVDESSTGFPQPVAASASTAE